MTTLGMSGTRSITKQEGEEILESRRDWLGTYNKFVTGGCRGWDAIAGEWLFLNFPDAHHVVIVPANRSQVDYWWEKPEIETNDRITVIEMPAGTPYKKRNQAIVDTSDHLYYCASYPADHGKSQRSGTWQTVRLAWGRKIPVRGTVLNVVDW